MTEMSVMPELDVFNLPVFADANIWSMWPADKLNELAEDIKENGFDHRYPLTIAEVDGVMMLLDGRNRREAAKIAGIIPPVIVTDIDPKLAVHRSNNQNRDATPGQKAMAFAMAWPDAINKGGRGKTSILEIEVSKPQITRARRPCPRAVSAPAELRALQPGAPAGPQRRGTTVLFGLHLFYGPCPCVPLIRIFCCAVNLMRRLPAGRRGGMMGGKC